MFRGLSLSGKQVDSSSGEQPPTTGPQKPPNPRKGSFLRYLPSKEHFSIASVNSADFSAASGSVPSPSESTSSSGARGLMAQAVSLARRGSLNGSKREESLNGSSRLPPAASTAGGENVVFDDKEEELDGEPPEPPEEFICPLSLDVMFDPVIVASGQTYERAYIERWIADGNGTCPKTRQPLTLEQVFPNQVLRHMIRAWCLKNKLPLPSPVLAEDVALAFAPDASGGSLARSRSSLSRSGSSVSEVASRRRRERAAVAERAAAVALESERQQRLLMERMVGQRGQGMGGEELARRREMVAKLREEKERREREEREEREREERAREVVQNQQPQPEVAAAGGASAGASAAAGGSKGDPAGPTAAGAVQQDADAGAEGTAAGQPPVSISLGGSPGAGVAAPPPPAAAAPADPGAQSAPAAAASGAPAGTAAVPGTDGAAAAACSLQSNGTGAAVSEPPGGQPAASQGSAGEGGGSRNAAARRAMRSKARSRSLGGSKWKERLAARPPGPQGMVLAGWPGKLAMGAAIFQGGQSPVVGGGRVAGDSAAAGAAGSYTTSFALPAMKEEGEEEKEEEDSPGPAMSPVVQSASASPAPSAFRFGFRRGPQGQSSGSIKAGRENSTGASREGSMRASRQGSREGSRQGSGSFPQTPIGSADRAANKSKRAMEREIARALAQDMLDAGVDVPEGLMRQASNRHTPSHRNSRSSFRSQDSFDSSAGSHLGDGDDADAASVGSPYHDGASSAKASRGRRAMEREIARAMARDMRQARMPRGGSVASATPEAGDRGSALPSSATEPTGLSSGSFDDGDLLESEVGSEAPSVDSTSAVDIEQLVQHCGSEASEDRAAGAALLRVATRQGFAAVQKVLEAGGVAPLVALLREEDAPTVEHAATALLNLSLEAEGRRAVVEAEGVVPGLVGVLASGIPAARANSAAALFLLSREGDAVREEVIRCGALDPLLELLVDGLPRAKKDAAQLMVSLCLLKSKRKEIAESGVIFVMCELLRGRERAVEEGAAAVEEAAAAVEEAAAAVFAALVRDEDGRTALLEEGAVRPLAEMVENGSERSKEYAVNALLGLAVNSREALAAIVDEDIATSVDVLTRTGTAKTQAKATALVELLRSFSDDEDDVDDEDEEVDV